MGSVMGSLDLLDWFLVLGVLVFGACLAVQFERKYKLARIDFILSTFYVAGLAAVLVGVYHVLRRLLSLTP